MSETTWVGESTSVDAGRLDELRGAEPQEATRPALGAHHDPFGRDTSLEPGKPPAP